MKKISLAKADLSKLSNEDLQKLYDITSERRLIFNFKKLLLSNVADFDYKNFNKKLDQYKVYLKLLDEQEQEILQKTL